RWRGHLHAAGMTLGVYANAPTIDWCRQRGLGQYFWQHDWGSGGRLNPAATLHQKAGRQWAVGGVMSDINDVYALDFGQWWPLDPITLAAGSLS
ncbi:MAG TPA: Tat pathway signal sequence domain protein, partial [Actinomycetales bacterium]|nr:Tat pathway signal sequence domain protein [Actinomycetales bacterium]